MDSIKVNNAFLKAQWDLVIQQSDFSLRTIADMIKNKSIDVSPSFQRRDRWDTKRQSALIESFILNVPVPPIYLSEDDYWSYSVIDWKQRITAIEHFLSDGFKLSSLKKIPDLNWLTFSKLPSNIQNALTVRPYIRVVTLLRQSDPDLKFEVFLRLNTGWEPLNPQEVRNVAYDWTLNKLLFELSENEILKERLKIVNKSSTAYRNMTDLEHILRFFTLFDRWEKIWNMLSEEMDEYMLKNQHLEVSEIESLSSLFKLTIETCKNLWWDHVFHRPDRRWWRWQLISPLYDAEMVAVAKLITENKNLRLLSQDVVLERTRFLFENEDFFKSVTRATNNPSNINYRISQMYEMLNEQL